MIEFKSKFRPCPYLRWNKHRERFLLKYAFDFTFEKSCEYRGHSDWVRELLVMTSVLQSEKLGLSTFKVSI